MDIVKRNDHNEDLNRPVNNLIINFKTALLNAKIRMKLRN